MPTFRATVRLTAVAEITVIASAATATGAREVFEHAPEAALWEERAFFDSAYITGKVLGKIEEVRDDA